MRKIVFFILILSIVGYLIACENEAASSSSCKTYDFADGLHIKDLQDRSCYDGELGGKQLNYVAKLYERQVREYSEAITAKDLQEAADQQKKVVKAMYREVKGLKGNKLRFIFRRLRDHSRRRELNYNIKLVEPLKTFGEVNAWVTYDGTIYVTTALLDFVESEDELAFVVAHELCHVENLLPDQMLARDMALEDLFGDTMLRSLFQNFVDKLLSGLNQRQEIVADRAALFLMHKAGFDPESSLDFFHKLSLLEEKEHNWGAIKQFWRTHPYSTVRFDCLNSYLYESRIEIPNCDTSSPVTSL